MTTAQVKKVTVYVFFILFFLLFHICIVIQALHIDLPGFDHAKYTYLYEAALDGGDIALSPTLPVKLRDVVLRMLDPKPDNRPEDAEVTNLLSISPEDARPPQDARPLNGLSRFMKPAP